MKSQWEFFMNTARTGNLSHAYLLSGNDIQKKSEVVFRLIRFLYCEHPGTMPCETCPSCKAVSKGLHPDFVTISKDGSEIKIAQILRLNSFLSLTSSHGKWKTIIIEEADCMNTQAQSAFLKLLEEPKGNTLFLLLTEYPDLLLGTIHSRTQEVPFILLNPIVQKEQDHWVKDLKSLQKQDIASRFLYAKSLSESPKEYQEMLKVWTIFLRELLLQRIATRKPVGERLKNFLACLNETFHALHTTNVSPALSLERLFLTL